MLDAETRVGDIQEHVRLPRWWVVTLQLLESLRPVSSPKNDRVRQLASQGVGRPDKAPPALADSRLCPPSNLPQWGLGWRSLDPPIKPHVVRPQAYPANESLDCTELLLLQLAKESAQLERPSSSSTWSSCRSSASLPRHARCRGR